MLSLCRPLLSVVAGVSLFGRPPAELPQWQTGGHRRSSSEPPDSEPPDNEHVLHTRRRGGRGLAPPRTTGHRMWRDDVEGEPKADDCAVRLASPPSRATASATPSCATAAPSPPRSRRHLLLCRRRRHLLPGRRGGDGGSDSREERVHLLHARAPPVAASLP
jgi:hypothetical protein